MAKYRLSHSWFLVAILVQQQHVQWANEIIFTQSLYIALLFCICYSRFVHTSQGSNNSFSCLHQLNGSCESVYVLVRTSIQVMNHEYKSYVYSCTYPIYINMPPTRARARVGGIHTRTHHFHGHIYTCTHATRRTHIHMHAHIHHTRTHAHRHTHALDA